MTTPVLRGPRPVAITPMKVRATSGLRKLAGQMQDAFPEMDVHQHLQDAARELDSGRTHNAQRHVNAAIFHLTPLQMRRHGVHDDAGHMRGKAFMQQAHRHLLLIKDIEDVRGTNDDNSQQRRDAVANAAQERAARSAQQQAPPGVVPQQPVAASWEDHLHVIELVAVHESAAGRRALAAKGHTAYGTSFPVPNVSYLHKALKAVGRVKPGKRGVLKRFLQKRAKQLGVSHHLKGTWAEPGAKNMGSEFRLAAFGIEDHYVHELVGPKGWSHGWVRAIGAGSATESITGGAGIGGTTSGWHPRQKSAYVKARKAGHSHNKALAVARAVGRGMGRAFQPGSAVPPPAGFANPSGPPPFVLSS
jgi:hypothetical protein